MRRALLLFLFAALSWPALARQDQSQNPPTTSAPPPSQAPAQPSTPAGAQRAPGIEAPPPSAKAKKKTAKRKTSRKTRKKEKKKEVPKKQPETSTDNSPHRTVVRRGGTSDTGGQLEPGTPASDAAHQRQTTEQLLQATDATLKSISQRKLNPEQQDMVRQITLYMQQSRSADEEGDLGRARNLAVKARMLSDALARQ